MRIPTGVPAVLLALATFAIASGDSIVSRQDTDYKVGYTPLKTNWTDQVGLEPWPEYPRPRMQRPYWKNLNGVWRYRNTTNGTLDSPPFGEKLEAPVLVPFCLESALSGRNLTAYDLKHG